MKEFVRENRVNRKKGEGMPLITITSFRLYP